ncbi:LysR family transcriptional regulator [Bacillus sp. AFS055030]|uniref:LysR family transcriptional regulator n=1 Tax=Bacillus sp. AFS055030 TaxID=2033507 RepID=UPI0015D4FADC|nr:LysR family transcriptional regulator [Bacillus sp. AFS055030]
MHFEQLLYIAEIGKQGSITTAAEKLCVSPPAISKSISNLEKELGIQIFTRSKKGMVPTHQGKAVIKKAFEVILKVDEFREEAKLQALVKTELKISCVPGLTYCAFDALVKLQTDFPEVIVEIQEKETFQVLRDIKNGKCDIGLLMANKTDIQSEFDIANETLALGRPCICVGKNSKFAFYEFVTPEDLQKECFVTNIGEFTRNIMNTYFSKNQVLIRTNNIEIIKKAIKEGVGITFAYKEMLTKDVDVQNGEIIIIPLKNCELLEKPVSYIYANDKQLTSPARTFLNYVQDFWIE